jgi:ABC-2 type transport system permease protein
MPSDLNPAIPAPRAGLPVSRRGESALGRVREIVAYRELLANLVRKELKVKYKDSTLGFVWSLLNPALYLVVFYIVFDVILGSGIPNFAFFLLSGLLVWNLFSQSLGAATRSIVDNGVLIKKVWFPREILPLASIGANLVHFFLQSIVLVAALALFRYPVGFSYLPLVPVALATLLLFLAGVTLLLAAANVYLRDTQHLLELLLLAWFWLTPIVYPYRLVADKLGDKGSLVLLNPMVAVVSAFQRAIYNPTTGVGGDGLQPILPDAGWFWYARNLGVLAVVSLVILAVAMAVFRRVEGNFAEEL